MYFYIDGTKYRNMISSESAFYIADDTSLLYSGLDGDYSVLLGGNWRFELVVDSQTGLCTHIQSFLENLEVTDADLTLPMAVSKDLYFADESSLEPGGGCHYHPFSNTAFWDKKKKVLCFGDPDCQGEAVEFTPKTIAVIKENQLKSIFLNLDGMKRQISFC